MSDETISPLRRRMIEDMTVRGIGEKTRNDYIRHVRTFSAFIGRSPDTGGAPLPAAPDRDRSAPADHQRRGGGAAFLLQGGACPNPFAVGLRRLQP
jgi:hypothetical protein